MEALIGKIIIDIIRAICINLHEFMCYSVYKNDEKLKQLVQKTVLNAS
jgi:hypothetical protein